MTDRANTATKTSTEATAVDSTIFEKPSIIVNMGAGSSSDISNEATAIFEYAGYPKPKIHLAEPSKLAEAFNAVKNDGTDLLVIYGGDGTCKAGATVARDAGISLIALPGGTMNMLPKALYGTDNWQEALKLALSQKQPRWQAAGTIGDDVFFCGAIIGDPTTMSEARESLREGDVVEAVKQIPDIMTAIAHGERFEFKVDGTSFDRDANALQIHCPFMTQGATSENEFELSSVPQLSVSQIIGIGARALTQHWRDSVHIKTAFGKNISINGQGAFDILLDGEPETINCPININLEEEGVLVLAPNLHREAK